MTLSLDTVITRETLEEVDACWSFEKVTAFIAQHGPSMRVGDVLACHDVTHKHRIWFGCRLLSHHRGPCDVFGVALEFARRSVQYAPRSLRENLRALLHEVATLRGASPNRCIEVRDLCWRFGHAADAAAYAARAARAAAYSDHIGVACCATDTAVRVEGSATVYSAERLAQLEILRRLIRGAS